MSEAHFCNGLLIVWLEILSVLSSLLFSAWKVTWSQYETNHSLRIPNWYEIGIFSDDWWFQEFCGSGKLRTKGLGANSAA
jgi:hypothetical protein